MVTRKLPEKFLVAFSLAGEQRDLVRSVAEAVEQQLGQSNVFLDEWFEYYIAGADAVLKLQEIYSKKSVLAVVCISQNYGDKPWTTAEHAAILDRYMFSMGHTDKLGVLPIRVGDGDVEGLPKNTIAPDVRKMTPADAAQLIVSRLGLIVPDLGAAPPSQSDWPQLTAVHWPMANHRAARDAFQTLLTAAPKFRFLPLRGPSEVGKSRITQQMLGNALQTPNLACGRFDFKGRTDMDSVVRRFAEILDVPVPPAGSLGDRLGQIFETLKQRAKPTLLIFDTYNEAPADARDWVENQLLPSLIRASWLRVVIAGQQAPEPAGALWQMVSSPVVTLQPPPATDWFAFSQEQGLNVDLAFVQKVYDLCNGKSSTMATILGGQG